MRDVLGVHTCQEATSRLANPVGACAHYYMTYDTFDILQDEEVSQPRHCPTTEYSLPYGSGARVFCVASDAGVSRLQVRQGLKTFSNWATYPQIYLNGSLIGGVDIIKAKTATVVVTFANTMRGLPFRDVPGVVKGGAERWCGQGVEERC